MKKYGNCPACNKRFPLRGGRVDTHTRPGTREPCPTSYAAWDNSNLPATERTPIEKERERRSRLFGPWYGMATKTAANNPLYQP